MPDIMVALEYGQRPQFDDMTSIMVGARLPIFAASKQRPKQREMAALAAREEAQALSLLNETWAQLAEARAEAERARSLAELIESELLPLAAATTESARQAYQNGQADVMTWLQSQLAVNRLRIELLRLTTLFHTAHARIQSLLGETRGGSL